MVNAATVRRGLAMGPERIGGEALGPAQFADIGRGDGEGGGGKPERGLARSEAGAGEDRVSAARSGASFQKGPVGVDWPALDRYHAVKEVAQKPQLHGGGSEDQGQRLRDAGGGRGGPEEQEAKCCEAEGGLDIRSG